MKLFRLLRAGEIECRVSTVKKNGVSLLLYKDARCDQNILDETVGPDRWQRKHELIDGKLFCSVGIRYERGNDGEWVWKQDVGTESFTEKEKGQASDSFKRACFNWGIGRELYSAPFIWVSDANITPKGNGFTCYDSFDVSHIAYAEDETISELEIVNSKTKKVVYTYGVKKGRGTAPKPEPQIMPDDRKITQAERQKLMDAIASRFRTVDERNTAYKEVIGRLGLKSSTNMMMSQLVKALEIVDTLSGAAEAV